MAISALDPAVALILIDIQDELLSRIGAKQAKQIVGNTGALADRFRARRLPVVIVITAGHPPGRVSGQKPLQANARASSRIAAAPGEHLLHKWGWGAFTNTSLEHRLRSVGVTQVVIAGLLTSISVQSTAREAYDLSFNVTIPVDATADISYNAHFASVAGIFPKLGEVGTAKEIIGRLA